MISLFNELTFMDNYKKNSHSACLCFSVTLCLVFCHNVIKLVNWDHVKPSLLPRQQL